MQASEFQDRWSVLYEHVSFQIKPKIAYSIVFILRRMAYVWIAVWMLELPGMQIISLNLSNLAMQVYQGVKPLKTRTLNVRETLNNILIAISTYIFMSFSDWGPEEETKYLMGWVLLATMSTQLLVQLCFAVFILQHQLKLHVIKYFRICRWRVV